MKKRNAEWTCAIIGTQRELVLEKATRVRQGELELERFAVVPGGKMASFPLRQFWRERLARLCIDP
jgi:hypothetical protein